jgi:hypothetical protein
MKNFWSTIKNYFAVCGFMAHVAAAIYFIYYFKDVPK